MSALLNLASRAMTHATKTLECQENIIDGVGYFCSRQNSRSHASSSVTASYTTIAIEFENRYSPLVATSGVSKVRRASGSGHVFIGSSVENGPSAQEPQNQAFHACMLCTLLASVSEPN